MNLADKKTIERLLNSGEFSFKKSLGQNFLIDPTVCPAMAEAACDKNTGAIEIGPGIGVLTRELSKTAKRVLAIELDERLKPILKSTLEDCQNTEVIFGDAMKLDIKKIIAEKFSDCEKICVCANLPYYITSPVIMSLLEAKLPLDNITVMVQKEAAERLCADVGTRESGAVTVAVEYFAESKILFSVDRTSFMPPPKVDSAVIQLMPRSKPPVVLKSEELFFKFVKACFAQRRKTLVNTVSNTLGVSKEQIKTALKNQGLSETTRSEQLSLENLAKVCNEIFGENN